MSFCLEHHFGLQYLNCNSWADPGGAIGAIAPAPKTYEVTLFTMILHNSENSIRESRYTAVVRPLFGHRGVVKYTLSLLQ